MSLRSEPLEQEVALPDGRVVAVRVGVAEDSYIPRRELDTVVLELWDPGRGEHLAGVRGQLFCTARKFQLRGFPPCRARRVATVRHHHA